MVHPCNYLFFYFCFCFCFYFFLGDVFPELQHSRRAQICPNRALVSSSYREIGIPQNPSYPAQLLPLPASLRRCATPGLRRTTGGGCSLAGGPWRQRCWRRRGRPMRTWRGWSGSRCASCKGIPLTRATASFSLTASAICSTSSSPPPASSYVTFSLSEVHDCIHFSDSLAWLG